MKRTYKYRIYPNKEQQIKINNTLHLCMILYNLALEQRISIYKNHKKSIYYNEQQNQLPELKKTYNEFKEIHSQVLQNVLHRVDNAYHLFFLRLKAHKKGKDAGFPRFKSADRYDSFTYPQYKLRLEKNRITLLKIGNIKIVYQRPIEGRVKTLTVKKEVDQYYVCITCEISKEIPAKKVVETAIGVDLGLNHFITLSNSETVDNPKYLKQSESKLVFQQKHLSRKKKGSKNRNKQKLKLARIHRKIRNQRKDFLHKLSRKLVNKYDLIVFEDLKVQNMLQNHHLAKSIADASWSKLVSNCVYKAEEAGKHCIKVNARDTTKECSKCHEKVHVPLWQRVYECKNCGLVIDRDFNAAKNILNRAGSARINACGDGEVSSSLKQDTRGFGCG